ncbi:MAG: hypothetical protein R3C56_23630 [Pirellulaceae bacterium]|jgi:hypothetical protein
MNNSLRLLVLSCVAIVGLTAVGLACQVPVFRYALERWTSDKYQVIVLTAGPLDGSAQANVARLRAAEQQLATNIETQTADISTIHDERLLELWREHQPNSAPLMVVLYPRTAEQVPDRVLEAAELTSESVERLLLSPVRQEVAERLSRGQSSVWIFVPCGDGDKDKLALDTLQQQIEINQKRLTVPTAEELDIEPTRLDNSKIPLRIEFSAVTLDRADPQEAFLLRALGHSEAELPNDEPLAFPVFGRGRVLYGLVGAGIMPETIGMACTFMTGPCSCQVKNQNPGFDLLLSHDWDQAVGNSHLSDPLPDESAEPRLLTIPPGRK